MSSDPTRPEHPLGRVAVLGLGRLGGSLARAVTGLQLADRITGWAAEATERDAALTAGAVTFAAVAWQDAVSDADLIVLAGSLDDNRRLLGALAGVAPAGATVTDLSPLKGPVLDTAKAAGLAWRWIGSHPMTAEAGSVGFWASRDDLFEGARVWTVSEGAAEDSSRFVDLLWTSLGARPRAIDAASHDRLMAVASQLPHLAASALAEVVEQAGVASADLGPGGLDMTRLASADPAALTELLEHVSPSLIGGLRGVSEAAARLADLLEDGDIARITAMMQRTRRWRGAGEARGPE